MELNSVEYDNEILKLEEQLRLSKLQEEQIDGDINQILSKYQDMPRSLGSAINRLQTKLALVESDSSQLSSMLSLTSVLAENISGKVRELDQAKSRVVDCLQRVEDILDLRLCTEGVQTALQNEDYEQAAGHIHRFLALDQSILELAVGDGVSEEATKQSYDVLKQAENRLKVLVVERFDDAVREEDVASMERFFKIFPLLNQHDLGLDKFSQYLKQKLCLTADKNYKVLEAGGQDDKRANVLYADALTLLFEGVARVLEVYQPLVETYYGPDRMLNIIENIQAECDVQARRIIDRFIWDRKYKEKAHTVEGYLRQMSKASQDPNRIKPIDVDVLLSEVTLMHTRAELYLRFVKRRVAPGLSSMPAQNEAQVATKDAKLKRLDSLVKKCGLSLSMQELIGQYIAMEEYFMRVSISKALDVDQVIMEGVAGGAPLTSTMVDDVFFVVKKCIRRSLSSSNVDCVCAMLNHAVTILELEFFAELSQRLKAGYPAIGGLAGAYTAAAAAYSSMLQQGKIPTTATDSTEKARQLFIVTLNNVDISKECLEKLHSSLKTDTTTHLSGISEQDKEKLQFSLGGLIDLKRRFLEAIKFALESQLATSAIKPRVKSWLETYNDVTHTPTEDEFATLEASDPFMEAFMTNLDLMLSDFKSVLTENNYDAFINGVAVEISQRFEKNILKATFNQLGGLLLDKQLRDLTGYLSNVTSWGVRERFSRLTQIANLLNVEAISQVSELYNAESVTWRLTPNEIRQVLGLRIDLPADDIRKLKL